MNLDQVVTAIEDKLGEDFEVKEITKARSTLVVECQDGEKYLVVVTKL